MSRSSCSTSSWPTGRASILSLSRVMLCLCLVLVPSASGRSRTRRIPFDVEHGAHVGATHHLALLNHPDVYEHLRRWVATAP